MTEPTDLNLHLDVDLFREAISYTSAKTGLTARLIERDYFCTVLLAYLADHGGDQLIFKGGTCLAKVHGAFYRLSEDLDFAISMPVDADRRERSKAVAETKNAVSRVPRSIVGLADVQPLVGANSSTQYNGAVYYNSPITESQERILIEVSVREPLLMPSERAEAHTILLHPVGGRRAISAQSVRCIAFKEAFAEKFRAALSRKEVAIRDFYDLDYAAEYLGMDPTDQTLLKMVRKKLAIPGNLPIDVGPKRIESLKRQLRTRLKAVLRDQDLQAFDLNRSIQLVTDLAGRLD